MAEVGVNRKCTMLSLFLKRCGLSFLFRPNPTCAGPSLYKKSLVELACAGYAASAIR
jgi:hypothetical protein